VGRKEVTPVLGSSRPKASKALASGPTSIPNAPFICRSMNPGQITPRTSRRSAGSSERRGERTTSKILPHSITTAARPNGSGASTLPKRARGAVRGNQPLGTSLLRSPASILYTRSLCASRPGDRGLLFLLRPVATVVPVAADVFELVALRLGGQDVHEGKREHGQRGEDGEGPRPPQHA
jgi:hypothetical protein